MESCYSQGTGRKCKEIDWSGQCKLLLNTTMVFLEPNFEELKKFIVPYNQSH